MSKNNCISKFQFIFALVNKVFFVYCKVVKEKEYSSFLNRYLSKILLSQHTVFQLKRYNTVSATIKKRDTVIMVNPITWLISSITPIWIKLPIMTSIVKREITYADSICNGR